MCGPNQRYSKTCVKRPITKRQKIGFQDRLSLNAGQKYRRMLQGKHSAILSTFIKLPLMSLRPLFCLFLSGHFTQVLLYVKWFPVLLYVQMGNHNRYSQLNMIGYKFLVQIFTVHVTKPKYWMSLC